MVPEKGTDHARPAFALSRKPVVMVVDDEEMVTSTLAALLEMQGNYAVQKFESAAAALVYLQRRPVDVVVTDFLMPEMDGLKFLKKVHELYPDLPGILLTGYADKENAIKALNEASVFQYIEKPWDNNNLIMMIRNALQHKTLKDVLEEKIKQLDKVLFERDKFIEQYQMLNDEMVLAQNVQRKLLAQDLPETSALNFHSKYIPALKIGGDFYDVIPLAGKEVAFLIADVTGHGIQAALITGLLKSSIQGMRNRALRPADILIKLNQRLFDILPANLYVAALVVVIDTASGACSLVNAGIPHPFLLKHKNRSVERIPANGLLLGIAEEKLFKPGEEVSFSLETDDVLLLFTDGITEVENEGEERFEHKMLETLEAMADLDFPDVLSKLVQCACDFGKPGHSRDDMTLLSIEYGNAQ